jgi:hypothetical protein
LFDIFIRIGTGGNGCCYYQHPSGSHIFDSNNGRDKATPYHVKDGIVKMIIDFSFNTIEFIADGNSCGISNMTTAGIGGGQTIISCI